MISVKATYDFGQQVKGNLEFTLDQFSECEHSVRVCRFYVHLTMFLNICACLCADH